MKILYVGSERSDAQAIATALRGIDQVVTVSWASQLEHVARWLDENRDLAAVIVESRVGGANWPSVLKHVRGLVSHPAVVVIVPDGTAPPFESHTDADAYIRRDQSLSRDLPVIVVRALERAVRLDLEHKLARATAALQDAEQRHRAVIAAADRQLAEIQAQHEIGMARAAATWDMVDEQLRTAALEVERARQDQASAAADVDRLRRQLAEADAAVEAANARTEHERLAASESVERQRDLQTQIAREVDRRRGVEDLLEEAVGALDDAEKRHTSDMTDATAQSRELEATLQLARQDLEAKAADIARLAAREEELNANLAEVIGSRSDLERRLAATAAAFDDAVTRATRDRLAATKKAAEREAELDGQIRRECATRATLEQVVADRETALRTAHQQHDAAVAAAAAELGDRQAHFDRTLTQTAADRDRLAQQLSDTDAALEQARHDYRAAAADIDRLTERETDLTSQLADVQTARNTLERHLDEATKAIREGAAREAELDKLIQQGRATHATLEQVVDDRETALRAAHQQHEAAVAVAAAELGERQAHFDRALTQTAADRDCLAQQLSDTDAALEQARHDYRAAAADIERLTERETDLTSQLADVQATRSTLQRQLDGATRAIRKAAAREEDLVERQAHVDRELTLTAADRDRLAQRLNDTDGAVDALEQAIEDAEIALEQVRREQLSAEADVERLTQREAELTAQRVDGQTALRDAQERHDGAQRETQQRHEAALTAAAADLAQRQAGFDHELSESANDRDRLIQRLRETSANLEDVCRAYEASTADVEHLTQREAELTSQLADGETAFRDAQQRHHAALAGAAATLAERQTHFDRELMQSAAERDLLSLQLSDTALALNQVRSLRQSAADEVERLTEREADLTSQLADAAELAQRQDHELSESASDRNRLVQRLSETSVDLDDVCRAYEASTADVERLTQHQGDLTSQLAEVQAARSTLEHQLAEATSAMQQAAEHKAELDEQIQQDRATRDTLEQALADAEAALPEAQQRHDAALAAAATEFAEHQAHLDRQLSLAAAERDTLRQSLATLQERSQQLQESLTASVDAFEASRAESHRLFEHAGVAMFRCTRDGALIEANRACTTLVGRRTLDELHGARFPASVFDAPNALFWLIERCLSTGVKETVESTWRRNDGGRLFVRLSARLSGSDVIEFVAEDLTRVRILEERLSQAHRMEAVGRLASEVAVTCGTLLRDIHENGREWLMTTGVAPDSRQRGERLLDDVRRAATLMQELAACGDEQQARTPMLVDLNTLIRDLEPVLRRVAGGDVEVRLQDISSPLNVDVGTERVERLLVNLASYGRGRMPFGGQLRIELGKSVVDRRFAAKHPNVRLGLHALITVTEIRRAAGTDGPPQPRDKRPGVDFGTLQSLVSECGGHLWMRVQPPGEMVAKIHLPLSSPDQTLSRTPATRGRRERLTARLFQT